MMRNTLLSVFFVCLLPSCGSSYMGTSYLKDLQNLAEKQLTSEESRFSLTIRPDDELLILVSAIDPAAAAPYNLPIVSAQSFSSRTTDAKQTLSVSRQQVSSSPSIQTYLVDSEGYINMPGLGKIKVAGMTKDELTAALETLLKEHIESPIVNIQLVNFRVSVIGEVMAPNSYNFSKQRVSIFEALAAAQDVSLQGRRDKVMIIRDVNGKKEYVNIDLTRSDVFSSPNYYLQQNDIVYVLPNKEKQKDADFGVQKQYNTSIIISAISTVISIIAIITR